MFCPQCGSSQSDELKFCKLCGSNLHAVRQILSAREPEEKFDWSKTWVSEMFLSEAERTRRKLEMERQQGITPEVKRYNEIKAGVITSCVGVALAIFLFVFMQGVILANVPGAAAEILSRLWIAGVIPLFVGIALIINGLFVSKKLVEIDRQGSWRKPNELERDAEPASLPPANTAEIIPSSFSVTEGTTRHLRDSDRTQ